MIATWTQPSPLIEEIRRYLAAVEAFRLLGHEPAWRPEPEPPDCEADRRPGARSTR